MSEAWTVKRMVAWMQADFARRGIESARLDADLLIARALGVERIALYLDPERPLSQGELGSIRALVERRRAREPMAYILGQREFYGRAFGVSRDVLIPRPDTETLVEAALAFLRAGAPEGPLLDLCTGSGAVAVTLAAECPGRDVIATDVSASALACARANALRHGVEGRVAWHHGDLFAALTPEARFACVTANPPYIASAEIETLAPEVSRFEPRLALDAGADALSFYRRIAREVRGHVVPGGAVFVEVGIGQAPAVRALFEAHGFVDLRSVRDLAGIERVVCAAP